MKIDHNYFDTFNYPDNYNLLLIILQVSFAIYERQAQHIFDFIGRSGIEICEDINRLLNVNINIIKIY